MIFISDGEGKQIDIRLEGSLTSGYIAVYIQAMWAMLPLFWFTYN